MHCSTQCWKNTKLFIIILFKYWNGKELHLITLSSMNHKNCYQDSQKTELLSRQLHTAELSANVTQPRRICQTQELGDTFDWSCNSAIRWPRGRLHFICIIWNFACVIRNWHICCSYSSPLSHEGKFPTTAYFWDVTESRILLLQFLLQILILPWRVLKMNQSY